ncbi:hypothetical protein B0H67DRAFT_29925 [Lasiosphaeris hirsuta]|uniref:Uncharacterized protein n=1 Tax=Lasiosphaeris hirsuta TaxID=260670 RepID=A0AA40B9X7_9PEZI|nr:hypothetical protein B0H67DRAFT_29925 [Lasiosphaeris hirsuta]
MLANPAPHHFFAQAMEYQPTMQPRVPRKRRAEAQPENNERLSKRLSLLNLEQSGTKLYIPVENTQATSTTLLPSSPPSSSPISLRKSRTRSTSSSPRQVAVLPVADDDDSMMQLDDSKYKVYIRNIDDELSSESEAEDGKLIFLPDIEKHLRSNRIPAGILASQPDPDILSKQLVLYSVPSSLSVPEEHDSVRKAVIEARARARERQQAELQQREAFMNGAMADGGLFQQPAPVTTIRLAYQGDNDDPDAMELD